MTALAENEAFKSMREKGVVGQILEEQAAKNKDKVFLYFEEQQISYRQMNAAANRVANGFLKLGVQKGDKVCIMLSNSPEYLYTWFGLNKIGAVEVPVNNNLRGYGLQYVINHCDAKIIVTGQEFLEQLKFVEDQLQQLETVIIHDEGPQAQWPELRFQVLPYQYLLDNPDDTPQLEISHTDPYAIIYTSGTTGPSKGVVLPNNYALWHARQRIRLLKIAPDDIFYTCLPLFHMNAQFISVFSTWVGDASVAIDRRFSASQFWDRIRKYNATEFNFIGAMAVMLYNQPPSDRDRDHRVRIAFGAPVPKEIYDDFEKRFNLKILGGFGMTELSPGLSNSVDDNRKYSMGRAIANHIAAIVDDDDREVPPRVIGELVYRPITPYSMMLGYYKMPEQTLQAFRNLWFHTGDYAYKDEDGYFYYVDRKKDAIRRRGENISSFEVEAVVNSHPAIAESAAIPVPSELGEDDVKVVAVVKAGEKLTPEELIAYLEPRMARFALPRYVEFVDSLPKTATLRVEKYKLRENWLNPNTWDREKATGR